MAALGEPAPGCGGTAGLQDPDRSLFRTVRTPSQVNCRKLVELADEYLQTPPITGRYHFVCCLALLSLQSQARGNSHRDIEELFAERGITVSREAIRLWCIKFGAIYTRRLKRRHLGYGDTFYIDEVFVK